MSANRPRHDFDEIIVPHSERLATLEKSLCGLREHTETRIVGLEKATELAKRTMEDRLAGMNEFRESLRDTAARQITRVEFEAAHQRVVDDIIELKQARDVAAGKASQGSVDRAMIIAVVGAIIGLASFILRLVGL